MVVRHCVRQQVRRSMGVLEAGVEVDLVWGWWKGARGELKERGWSERRSTVSRR